MNISQNSKLFIVGSIGVIIVIGITWFNVYLLEVLIFKK